MLAGLFDSPSLSTLPAAAIAAISGMIFFTSGFDSVCAVLAAVCVFADAGLKDLVIMPLDSAEAMLLLVVVLNVLVPAGLPSEGLVTAGLSVAVLTLFFDGTGFCALTGVFAETVFCALTEGLAASVFCALTEDLAAGFAFDATEGFASGREDPAALLSATAFAWLTESSGGRLIGALAAVEDEVFALEAAFFSAASMALSSFIAVAVLKLLDDLVSTTGCICLTGPR